MDIEELRAQTPGCAHVLHLNNAGASLPPSPVLDAVVGHLRREATIGGYEAAAEASERLSAFYETAAELVGGRRDEIAFVESATRAWQLAFYGMPWSEGDVVLTAQAEYGANMVAMLHLARTRGVVVRAVPSDATGQLDVAALESMIDARTRLIAVTHVPTNGGLVNPAAEIGAVARRHGVPYLLDACQSVGQMPLDVAALGCDMLSVTGRKYLRGPRGTGFLWVRRDFIPRLHPPVIDGKSAQWVSAESYRLRDGALRFECWERHMAGVLGLEVAMRYALSLGLEAIEARITALAEGLRARLSACDGVQVHDLGLRRCGLVTFTAAQRSPGEIKAALRARDINVSVSDVESTRLDMEARGLRQVVRASVHCYNTDAELDRFVQALRLLLQRDAG